MTFNVKLILPLLNVGESLKISELFSLNPLATSLVLTISSALIYFLRKKTHFESISFHYSYQLYQKLYAFTI